MTKTDIQSLLTKNTELINSTALRDCHCLGLHSFILDTNPKVRLFIAEPTCELYQPFDPWSPIVPIHPHKYDDEFMYLQGKLIQHIYELSPLGEVIESYSYKRIGDSQETELLPQGKVSLHYKGRYKDISFLKANTLHTGSLEGSGVSSWIIIEGRKDLSFEQVAYHRHLTKRRDLYKPFENPVDYLKAWSETLYK